jgi:hypothetical protein
MSQLQIQQNARSIPSAEQKYAQLVNSLNLKIINAMAKIKKMISKWASSPSSRNPHLGESLSLRALKDRHREIPLYYGKIC